MEDWNLNTTRLQRNIVLQSAPSYSVSVSSSSPPEVDHPGPTHPGPPVAGHDPRNTCFTGTTAEIVAFVLRALILLVAPWIETLRNRKGGPAHTTICCSSQESCPSKHHMVTREMAAPKTRPQDRRTQQDPAFQFVMMIEREWLGGFARSNDDLWEFL